MNKEELINKIDRIVGLIEDIDVPDEKESVAGDLDMACNYLNRAIDRLVGPA